jgi:hypothetical protein
MFSTFMAITFKSTTRPGGYGSLPSVLLIYQDWNNFHSFIKYFYYLKIGFTLIDPPTAVLVKFPIPFAEALPNGAELATNPLSM